MCESLKLNRKGTPSNQVNENFSKNTPKMTKKKENAKETNRKQRNNTKSSIHQTKDSLQTRLASSLHPTHQKVEEIEAERPPPSLLHHMKHLASLERR
jgi:hypothetical protein